MGGGGGGGGGKTSTRKVQSGNLPNIFDYDCSWQILAWQAPKNQVLSHRFLLYR